MIIIFFGPPGAGKGTQASLLSKILNIPHLSTGDILRNKLQDKDDLSSKLKQIMDDGNLVSDQILNKIVSIKLNSKECSNGFILDGYPRTISQNNFLINFLEKNDLKISNIFDLKVKDTKIIERIKYRSSIENREDDKEDIIKNRISKYISETKPLSDFYLKNYIENYHQVNANQEIENIHEDILKITKK